MVLANKGIAQVGTPMELYERPENEFVAQFIGSPAMNLLAGEVTGTGRDHNDNAGGWRARDLKCTDHRCGQGPCGKYRCGLKFFFPTGGQHVYEGRVDITEALGEVTLLYSRATTRENQVICKVSGAHKSLRGEVVRLGAQADKVHLFHNGKSLRYRD